MLVVIILVVVVFGVTVIKLQERNRALNAQIPHLVQGESIEYFDLIDLDLGRINVTALKTGKPKFIFIFPRPCAPCSSNILFWNRMAKMMTGRGEVFGILLGGPDEIARLSESKKMHFKLYVPENPDLFQKKMRIQNTYAQTILYHENEVKMIKMGDLEGSDFTNMLKEARKLAKKSKEDAG